MPPPQEVIHGSGPARFKPVLRQKLQEMWIDKNLRKM